MKKFICFLTALVLICVSFTACAGNSFDVDIDGVSASETETDFVMIRVKGYGDIVIKLFPETAPQTVANFKKLVSEKFYDGIIFHRVIENFMIQGGDPDGDGSGGSPDNIYGEFYANGFANDLLHNRGVVSMARLGNDNNSASSQFFIMHVDYPYLDGSYASFGYVIHGMNVVDAIARSRTDSNDRPMAEIKMEFVRFVNVEEGTYTVPEDIFDTSASDSTHVAPTMDQLDFSEISDVSKVSVSDSASDHVIIDVRDMGKIVVRLFPEVAPETVANFKKLVSENFYDGIIFHRVIENFMIQGGDPDGDGTGGSDEKIKGEFNANKFINHLEHKRGVISMARLGNDNNSATSQFFIMHVDYPSLNGNYASFGYVVYGMDTVDAIASVETDKSDKPLTDVVIDSIRFATVEK